MSLSKKEISILIEITYSIVFALIFLPYFYENQEKNLILIDGLIEKIIQIIVSTVIYFSIAYSVLEVVYKKKENRDERDDMISSKAYKLGFRLYELSLFVLIGILLSNSSIQNSGAIMFFILVLLLSVLLIKSVYQLYLYRTS